ncbi:MAG: hypothetical protein ACOY90_08920 [Candidatus Zhuqueibacterota bacterium]
MYKMLMSVILVICLIPAIALGQLKIQDKATDVSSELRKTFPNQFSLFGFLDPSKFSMSHSVSMSYFSVGGSGIAQNMYLNTMSYQIADPLLLRVQWGVQNYPFNNLAKDNPLFQSGFFLSGAELNYKPSDNMEFKIQFSRMPGSMYNNYRYYRDPFSIYNRSMFQDDDEN